MRRKKCKSIEDKRLIMAALHKCFSSSKTKKRSDTFKLFNKIADICSQDKLIDMINSNSLEYKDALSKLADYFLNEIKTDTISFPKARYEKRKDNCNGKVRDISILHVKQLVYDHIAVMALGPALRSIGQYQVSSIKGKGQSYAIKHIKKWLFDKKIQYFVKLDIKKFFPSIDKVKLVRFINQRVDNKKLIRLIARLVLSCESGPRGIHIGSYLSQSLANYYLSYIYHKVEGLHYTRRGKKIRYIRHMIFYMDDFLLLGRNKRKLQQAAAYITKIAKEDMDLTIKQNYCVHRILNFKSENKDKGQWIDMIGFRFSKQGISLRKNIFRRARRQFLRVRKSILQRKRVSLKQCMAFISYMGFLKYTNAYKLYKASNIEFFYEKAKDWVRYVLRIKMYGFPIFEQRDRKRVHFFRGMLIW